MKKVSPILLLALLLTSCNGWVIQPPPYIPPTYAPTWTPPIYTPTPIVFGVTPVTMTAVATTRPPVTVTASFTPSPTLTSSLTASPTPSITLTNTPGPSATATTVPTTSTAPPTISVDVLGCNTSIDITHGMGEVTNAYVILRNTGAVDATNLIVTLNALDEGRVHPDKIQGVSLLAVKHKVTLKLTVDSTYKQETPIQIEVSGDAGLFQRVGKPSCKDLGFAVPDQNLSTPVPDQ